MLTWFWHKIYIGKYDDKFKHRGKYTKWCSLNLKEDDWKCHVHISKFGTGTMSYNMLFRNKEDYTLFRLTWID